MRRSLIGSPIGRYVVVGGSVYVVELGIILIAQQRGAAPVPAVALSFWTGLMLSFVLQKLVTFKDRRTASHVLLPQVIAFSLLVLFNFGFTIAVTRVLAGVLPPTLTRTLALGITTLWNFYFYKTRLFKGAAVPLD